jgi:thiol-disulfide isomerase/thioredoxin
MTCSPLSCLLAFAFALAQTAVPLPVASPVEEPFADLSYAVALQRAQNEGKLLLVDATAVWCPPCKKMDRETWPDPVVTSWIGQHALAIQIDVDEQQELARTLTIEAMPTVIAFKDGAEFDRIVGFRDAPGLIAWLDDVKAGKRTKDVVLEKAQSLEGSTDVKARFDLARALLQQGEYERALGEFIWLWPNSRKLPAFAGVRLSFMLSDIQRLCSVYEPAREAFSEILDEVDLAVQLDRATEYLHWAEWFALGAHLDESARVLAFYEARRDAEGRLPLRHLDDFERRYVVDALFDVLMEHERVADAARLAPDLEVKAHAIVKQARAMAEMEEQRFGDQPELLDSMQQYRRTSAMQGLGRLHAAALAVDRPEQAVTIGALLLAEYDEADARLALVRYALPIGKPLAEHRRWLDEAEQAGGETAELRGRLDALQASPGVTEAPAAPAEADAPR